MKIQSKLLFAVKNFAILDSSLFPQKGEKPMTSKEKINPKSRGSMNMKWISVLMALVLVVLVIGACTAGPSELRNVPDEDGDIAGFWKGLWHGFISPFTFIVSLFTANVNVFEVHNNGNWYMAGFLMGASAIFGGSGGGAARRRRRRRH